MSSKAKYLHCIDFSNKLKVLNLSSTATISSLLVAQLFANDKGRNPRYMDIQQLKNCTVDEINGMTSPRMFFVFQRTIFNSWTHRQLTEEEKIVVKKGNLEIDFEKGRRKYNFGSPSRLSCLYLMEDNIDAKSDLRNMFIHIFRNPLVLEVRILNKMELMKFDYRWVDRYYDDPKEKFIKNYWTSIPYDEKKQKWEYLLEGTIEMTNQEQYDLVSNYAKEKYTEEYKGILLTREQLKNQSL
jgi:hypothetical protein